MLWQAGGQYNELICLDKAVYDHSRCGTLQTDILLVGYYPLGFDELKGQGCPFTHLLRRNIWKEKAYIMSSQWLARDLLVILGSRKASNVEIARKKENDFSFAIMD